MAFGGAANAGSASSKTSGTTTVATVSVSFAVGDLIIVGVGADNLGTTDADTTQTTVTDSQGNVYTRLKERTNGDTAGAGIVGALWIARVTVALTSAVDTVTVTHSSAVTARAMGLGKLTVAAGKTWQLVTAATHTSGDNGTAPSVSFSGLASGAYAWLVALAVEGPSGDTFTQDTDYTSFNAAGTTGGAGDSNATVRTGRRLATLTGDTYAPTLGTARDYAVCYAVIAEVDLVVDATANPAVVNMDCTIPTPGVSGGGTASPSTVAAVTTQPAVTASGSAVAQPATVNITTTIPIPTVTGTAVASPVSVAVVMQSTDPVASGGARAPPVTVAVTTDVPQVNASGGAQGTASPAAVSVVTTIPAPTVTGGGRAALSAVTVTTDVPAVTSSGGSGASASPGVVAVTTTIPAATVTGGAVASPAAVLITTSIEVTASGVIVIGDDDSPPIELRGAYTLVAYLDGEYSTVVYLPGASDLIARLS